MRYPDSVILLFARAPIAGKVNTRLIPELGIETATQLQYDLIHQRLKALNQARLCEVVVMCTPDISHACFTECHVLYSILLHLQQGENIGEKMLSGIVRALKKKSKVIVIGTDAPSLDIKIIDNALMKLHDNANVVITPAEDGGYVLIGVDNSYPALFSGITWGTEKVMQQTRDRISQSGLICYETESCWDIDRPKDYQRYLLFKNNRH